MEEKTETAVSTPDGTLTAIDALNSVKVSLADLCAKATSHYAYKNYEEAADYFARASELQAELNGEMDPQNAEILFLYGRSLFKVGQSKSDVLGGRAGGEKKKPKGAATSEPAQAESSAAAPSGELEKITEEGNELAPEENRGDTKEDDNKDPKKPLFQFTGDENFEDSDGEEGEEAPGDEEDEEDDFAVAFEVLDLARVLFTRKLEQPEEVSDKGKSTEEIEESPMIRHVKERLADTHDLLAEISLENERFPNAVSDFKSSLAYKQELYPKESEIIAEAHYKLSLALEFASITSAKDDDNDSADAPRETHVDEAMREEAAKELEAAIESTKLKLQNKEVELASTYSVDDNDITISQIAEVKEIIADMEQRLVDLRAPPIDVNAAINGPGGASSVLNPMGGILGAAPAAPGEVQARINEAKKSAKDVTGLVRKKVKPVGEAEGPGSGANGNGMAGVQATNGHGHGKRKADDVDAANAANAGEEEQDQKESSSKKAKLDEEDAVTVAEV